MRIVVTALAALLASGLATGAVAESLLDEVQDDEAPGSEIEMDIGRGNVEIGRERAFHPSPVEVEGQVVDAPNDPDVPVADDPVDAQLPGQGPEDLSGPDDDDPLPD